MARKRMNEPAQNSTFKKSAKLRRRRIACTTVPLIVANRPCYSTCAHISCYHVLQDSTSMFRDILPDFLPQ